MAIKGVPRMEDEGPMGESVVVSVEAKLLGEDNGRLMLVFSGLEVSYLDLGSAPKIRTRFGGLREMTDVETHDFDAAIEEFQTLQLARAVARRMRRERGVGEGPY